MLQKEKRVKMLNLGISFVCAVIMVWLRSGGEIANSAARINIGGILCSTSDFFLIVVTALCGYRYGIVVFIGALVGELILEKNGVNSLFSLYIYLIVMFLTEDLVQRRWFAGRWKSFLAAIFFTFALGISWYVTFRVIYGNINIFQNMGLEWLVLSAIPESIASCLFLYLFFHFAPDSFKLKIGNGYLYLSDYETGKYLSKKSPLRHADMDYSAGCKCTFDGAKSDEWKEGIIVGGNGLYAPDAHILVVDDNDMNRKVFKSLLKNFGMRIDDAGSGDEAVRLAKEHQYEMIFF